MLYNFYKRILLKVLPFLIRLSGLTPPAFAATAAIIENSNKEILAIDLAYKAGYSLPGGGVNAGESFEEALIREVKEETNLDVKSYTYLGSNYQSKGAFAVVSACYKVEIKDIKKLKSSSEGEIFWIKPIDLYKNCAYGDIKKHLKSYFNFS